ncbi:MAG TPA: hypothetical protein VJA66_11690, partial [Thermoanaerobaculia bacterium]
MKKGVGRAVGAGSAANRAVPNGVLALALLVAAADLAAQGALGNGQLQIIGTGLDVSPEAQTVPIGVPTRIDTRLPLAPGVHLPPSVSVRGELNGPGLLSTLSLTAEPNGFFSIPAQTV